MAGNEWSPMRDLLKNILQRNQVPVKVVEKVSLQVKVLALIREQYPKIADSLGEVEVDEETLVVSLTKPEASQYLALRTRAVLKKIYGLPGGEAVQKVRIKGK
ncbi:hypothetical protein AUK40_03020 [Candidatus Wirthbacteria bacterium CG2_30_54_11]|uniref:Uncharacterized protein n=1 Tax=Candidatus Wirthbacteria bacterium CG2_30_54_11 TaxID=1817892 RepID=A0A1J5IZ69_9BACT|nr:MAG: hypothetical protein AUK40_03020 [Candidatus Wirthbacteria bacterium CG2_30_54_11]